MKINLSKKEIAILISCLGKETNSSSYEKLENSNYIKDKHKQKKEYDEPYVLFEKLKCIYEGDNKNEKTSI